jgi:hypothetical protein
MSCILTAWDDTPQKDGREREGRRLKSVEKERPSYGLPRQRNLDTLSSFML